MAGDPYEELLGIPPDVRPVDYYTLLDVQRFCDDASKVDAGVKRQLARLEPYRTGADAAQRAAAEGLRDEIDQARACLKMPIARQAYERILARQRNEAMGLVPTAEAVPPPPAAPAPPPVPPAPAVAPPPAAEAPSAPQVTPPPGRTRRPPTAVLLVSGGVLLTIAVVAAIMAFRDKPPEPADTTAVKPVPRPPVKPAPPPVVPPAPPPVGPVQPPPPPVGTETRPAKVQQVLPPLIQPPARAIRGAQPVYVSCKTRGVILRYTTDGRDPTPTSRTCGGSILVRPGTTLKIRAYRDGYQPSAVVKAVYTDSTAVASPPSAAARAARARAAVAWQKVRGFHPAQGFDAKLRAIASARNDADSAYRRGDHAVAKAKYDYVVELCKDLETLDSRRTSIMAIQRAAEPIVKVAADGRSAASGSLLARLRKASADARRAFDAGLFDEAASQWRTALALARQVRAAKPPKPPPEPDPPVPPVVPPGISDKQYAPWKRLCDAVAAIHEAISDPGGDSVVALIGCQADLDGVCSSLPADELNAESKAVRTSAGKVLASVVVYRKACEAARGSKDKLLRANKVLYRNKLRSGIVVFVSDSMALAKAAGKKPSAALAKLYTKLEPQIEAHNRCKFCQGSGRMPCPDCRVKGRPTGKAPCADCDGTGHVKCTTCGGGGNSTCTRCKGTGRRKSSSFFSRSSSYTTCTTCNGTGLVHKSSYGSTRAGPCRGCRGGPAGKMPCRSCKRRGFTNDACPTCSGTKKVPCTHCAGGKNRP